MCVCTCICICVYIYKIFNPKAGNNTKEVLPDSQNSNPVDQSSLKYLKLKLNLSCYTALAIPLGKNTRNKPVVSSSTFAKCSNFTYNFHHDSDREIPIIPEKNKTKVSVISYTPLWMRNPR